MEGLSTNEDRLISQKPSAKARASLGHGAGSPKKEGRRPKSAGESATDSSPVAERPLDLLQAVWGKPSVGVEEKDRLPQCPLRAPIHLGGPLPDGTDQDLCSRRFRDLPAPIRSLAVDDNYLMGTGIPAKRTQSLGENGIFIQDWDDDGDHGFGTFDSACIQATDR